MSQVIHYSCFYGLWTLFRWHVEYKGFGIFTLIYGSYCVFILSMSIKSEQAFWKDATCLEEKAYTMEWDNLNLSDGYGYWENHPIFVHPNCLFVIKKMAYSAMWILGNISIIFPLILPHLFFFLSSSMSFFLSVMIQEPVFGKGYAHGQWNILGDVSCKFHPFLWMIWATVHSCCTQYLWT